MAELYGEFETHLTVNASSAEQVRALSLWAADRGVKCIHILLDRGATPSQPMLTYRDRGTFDAQLGAAHALAKELADAGFVVARFKLEIDADHPGAPQSERDAQRLTASQYFEHHVKLLLHANSDGGQLRELAERHAAHLSRNAFRIRNDGCQERFVTQRCIAVGRGEAQRCLRALLSELRAHHYEILETEEEFTVFDSNENVDAGWIMVKEQTCRSGKN